MRERILGFFQAEWGMGKCHKLSRCLEQVREADWIDGLQNYVSGSAGRCSAGRCSAGRVWRVGFGGTYLSIVFFDLWLHPGGCIDSWCVLASGHHGSELRLRPDSCSSKHHCFLSSVHSPLGPVGFNCRSLLKILSLLSRMRQGNPLIRAVAKKRSPKYQINERKLIN